MQTGNVRPGASVSTRSLRDRWQGYLAHHRRVAWESLQDLLDVWLSSLMTWLVIGIAMALPTILYLILSNITNLSGDWDGRPRISVYLNTTVSDDDGRAFARRLEQDAQVASLVYISPTDALTEFTERSGFGDILATLDRNPLPAVIALEPVARQAVQLKLLVAQLASEPLVESVSFDLAWIERLFAILALAERFVTALGGFLGLGVLLAIGNTIRLAIENRRAEIEVVKLVGGTDSFVRRPFLYLGFWYGVGGAVSAWLLVVVSLIFLAGPVENLLAAYQGDFVVVGLGFWQSVMLLMLGGSLGVIGAALAVGRHLSKIEPG
ncbi:MAG: cell division transport system permease protein [Cyclobacteriaceae bacterium]|jgi:cell division transport system permease protein